MRRLQATRPPQTTQPPQATRPIRAPMSGTQSLRLDPAPETAATPQPRPSSAPAAPLAPAPAGRLPSRGRQAQAADDVFSLVGYIKRLLIRQERDVRLLEAAAADAVSLAVQSSQRPALAAVQALGDSIKTLSLSVGSALASTDRLRVHIEPAVPVTGWEEEQPRAAAGNASPSAWTYQSGWTNVPLAADWRPVTPVSLGDWRTVSAMQLDDPFVDRPSATPVSVSDWRAVNATQLDDPLVDRPSATPVSVGDWHTANATQLDDPFVDRPSPTPAPANGPQATSGDPQAALTPPQAAAVQPQQATVSRAAFPIVETPGGLWTLDYHPDVASLPWPGIFRAPPAAARGGRQPCSRRVVLGNLPPDASTAQVLGAGAAAGVVAASVVPDLGGPPGRATKAAVLEFACPQGAVECVDRLRQRPLALAAADETVYEASAWLIPTPSWALTVRNERFRARIGSRALGERAVAGPAAPTRAQKLAECFDVSPSQLSSYLAERDSFPTTEYRVVGSTVKLTRRAFSWVVSAEDDTKLLMANTLHEPDWAEEWDQHFATHGSINLRTWERYGMLARHRRHRAAELGMEDWCVPHCDGACEWACGDIKAAPVPRVVKRYLARARKAPVLWGHDPRQDEF